MVTTSEGPTSPDAAVEPGAGDAPPEDRPAFEPASVRGPALLILGIAVLLVVSGVVASAVVSGHDPVYSVRSVTLPDGTRVALSPATSVLRGIASSGEPPADVLGNLGVPAGSRVRAIVDSDQHAAQFDRTASLTDGHSSNQLVDSFRTLLPKLGWQLLYDGPAPQGGAGSVEVLAKHGSGDGYYWEVGVVVSPTTSAGVTPYSIELFEIPDDH